MAVNEQKLRLNKIAREFKVGQSTIVEFLEKKGIKVENAPSSIIEPNVFDVIEKEFGKGVERVDIRERMKQKHETISLDTKSGKETPVKEDDFEHEVVIKSGGTMINDVPTLKGPKILGKIDISQSGQKPKPAENITKPVEKVIEKVVEKVVEKPAEKPVEKVVKPAENVAKPQVAQQQPNKEKLPQNENNRNMPKQHEQKVVTPTAPTKKAEQAAAAQALEAPVLTMASEEAQNRTYDERNASSDNVEVFRATGNEKLTAPKVLGTIDLKSFEKKKPQGGGANNNNDRKREKRKRIVKDNKIDVAQQKSNPGAPRPKTGTPQQGGGAPHAHGGGQRPAGAGGGANRPHDNKKKPGTGSKFPPKPVVRQEVSEEDVQKQIKDTLARLTSKGNKSKSAKYRRDKRDAASARVSEKIEREESEKSVLKVTEFVSVSELATMMDVAVTDVIMACMNLGLMVSINQRLDAEALVVVAEEFGFKVEFVTVEIQEAISDDVDNEEDLLPRSPIVTVMGHVDHGKTSLLDNIRNANVIAGEAGGITQHIGAYSVKLEDGRKITFLDTPGHEAFTAMRARGAKVTDVAIIIIAADDSVMPQTIEAINHASAAGVPIVFAINKVDKEGANPDKIREQLAAMNYLVEDWGGKYQCQEISAKKGLNLDKLLEKVLLEAEFLELKANPNKKASGNVIESTLDKGRGYVATILVQSGTLKVGDVLLSGIYSGRVKAMFNERGQRVEQALPATPVLVLGLSGAPQAGDTFNVMDDDKQARDIANKREQLQRMQGLKTQKHITLDEIGRRIAIGNFKELNIIIKGDVDGSIEALTDSLMKLSKDEVQVNVIHKAVGQISESDVLLAAASNAIIIGFQVRPSSSARKIAEKEEIEIRLYSIIYDAINEIKDAIEGMLAPIMREEIICSVEVLETFKVTKVGTVAGCIVREGKITRNTKIRIIRDGIVVYTGKLGSLKRFKDDVKEVTNNLECGLNIENYNDVKIGDTIEGYEDVEVKRK